MVNPWWTLLFLHFHVSVVQWNWYWLAHCGSLWICLLCWVQYQLFTSDSYNYYWIYVFSWRELMASFLIQMYRGRMKDGSFVAIRCLKMNRSHTTQSFMHYIELLSKLRHRHLVSALGHCFECYLDDSSVSRLFLVFEYVPKRTLRSWVSSKPTNAHVVFYLQLVYLS